jgi:hypothetical protein
VKDFPFLVNTERKAHQCVFSSNPKMEEMMSLEFDPKKQTAASVIELQPPPEPKVNLLQKWFASVYDGYLKESLHPQTYCERAWVQQTGTPPSQATQVFLRTCMNDCIAYRAYNRWSRFN